MTVHRIDYAVPADRERWLQRVERACSTLEALFPGTRLTNAVQAGMPDKTIADRSRYLEGRLKHSAWLFTLDNGKRANADGYVQTGGRFNEPSNAVYDLGILFTADGWTDAEHVFTAIGDAVDALWAQVTPEPAMRALIAYYGIATGRPPFISRPDDVREAQVLQAALARIGRQLPRFGAPLTDLRYRRLDDPAQARELGWINYWSPRTCEYIGFPDPERDSALLAHSYRTPAGTWLVKLCAEPLDLTRADHLSTLADAYARFPKLGISALRSSARE